MKKLLTYLATTSILAMVASTAFFEVVNAGLRQARVEEYGKLAHLVLDDTPHEMLFLGSSRARVHFHPVLIEEVTGTECYNAGFDGARILEMELLLGLYLERHPPPKLIVANVDFTSLATNEPIFKFTRYLPYMGHPEVRSLLMREDARARAIAWLPFLGPTFQNDYDTLTGMRSLMGIARPDGLIKGFSPAWIPSNPDAQLRAAQGDEVVITEEGLASLRRLIAVCHKSKIPIILVYCPQYVEVAQILVGFSAFMDTITNLAAESGVPFLRYDGLELCASRSLFVDLTHLNEEGAAVFSRRFATDLIPLLK